MLFAVVNHKGGVGKTTLAVHLAVWHAERGRRVVLLDSDAQRTASRWLNAADSAVTAIQVLEADDLIENAGRLRESHDTVVIDGPANLAECTRAALLVADLAVIPCGATLPELEATASTLRMVTNARSVRGMTAPAPLLVMSRLRSPHYRLTREAIQAAAALHVPVAQAVSRLREAVADSPGQRTTVWRLGARAAAASSEMLTLMEEIENYAQQTTNIASTAHCGAA